MPQLTNVDNGIGISPVIEMFGDSLTAGTGGTPVTTLLSWMLTPRLIKNWGIGGQTSIQIAARQGGQPIFITLSGNAFNGNNAVSVTSISPQPMSTASDTTARYYSGTVSGIQCMLVRTVVSTVETYTLQPLISQNTAIPANSIFIPDQGFNAQKSIQVLWLGRNDASPWTGLDTTIANCVSKLSQPKRAIIIGVLNAQDETIGTARYNAIAAINATIAAAFPNNYIPSTPPTAAEFAAQNWTPSSQDNTDVANGIIPASWHSDNVHLNTYGYQLFAGRIYNMMQNFGW